MNDYNYPSEFIDPVEKNKKKYCLAYARAFHKSAARGLESKIYRNSASIYEKRRKLANGTQDSNDYLKAAGVKGGKNGKSWKVLDTNILPIAPKFVELLTGKIVSKGYDSKGFSRTIIKGIDRKSVEEEKDFKADLSEQVINKDFVGELQQKGINMPLNEDGTPVPDSVQEVDTYAQIFRKDEYAMEAKDAMVMWFEANSFEQTMYEVVEDLVKIGDGGVCSDLDHNGNVNLRKIVPDRMISNQCGKKDGKDLYRIGEYIDVTISDLREMWPGQDEEVFKEIAEQARNERYSNDYLSSFHDTNMSYPYDSEKVTILHARWLSTDKWKHLDIKDKNGGRRIAKRPHNFPTDYKGKPVDEKSYSKKHPDKKIITTEIKNVYQCKYIVGTEHCFDIGLVNNIHRTKNSLYGANLGFHLYHITNPIIDKIEGIINMCQVAWLQHQNLLARMKPTGLAIEMSAIEGLAAGKNKEKLTMKEAVRMYFDTGVVFWRRKNFSNASNQFNPITELTKGASDDVERTLALIFSYIDLLRNILGVNEVEDASTPNPEILKGVAEMAALGTKHALKDLYQAAKSIYERTAKAVIDLTPDAREISKHKGFENALGTRSDQFWKELGLREMGIIIEEGPDAAQKQIFETAVNKSVDTGVVTPDEGAEFLMDDNLIRAAQSLKDKIKKRQKEMEESEMKKRTHESDENIRANQAASQARLEEIQSEIDVKKALMTHETDEEVRKAQLLADIDIEKERQMKQIDADIAAEAREDDQEHELDVKEVDIEGKIEIEKSKPKPTIAAPMSK